MSRSSRSKSILISSLALTCAAALGLPAGAALAGGDAAAGKAKALACQACHISANPDSEVPRLVGQRASYLTRQLKAFKKGDRKNGLMNAIASQLSDADVENLAAFWIQEPAGSDAEVPAATLPSRNTKMTFPKAFPRGFIIYHTEFSAEEGAVSRSYANAAAVAAIRAGKPLPNGSVIIVGNYAAKLDAQKQPIREGDGYAVGEAQSFAGMEARAGWGKDIPELLRNGTWNYGLFTGEKAPRAELNQAMCLACHKPKASDSYVFSLAKLQEKVRPATKPLRK
ncbi:MAG: cytochrome P460 family protein [Kofleriaceae bacterium]